MELGTFAVSLTVKNIAKSKSFYETLGFKTHEGCGSVGEKWLIMGSGTTNIGLFEGMFENNILTFNPRDARAIEKHIVKNGLAVDTTCKGNSGPAHCVLKDPDGNVIMFDQYV
ncbi:MAG: putative lactoylglutathione lyase [Paraglaciecola sp.]|jgi:predicted lactoylglutathione lyase